MLWQRQIVSYDTFTGINKKPHAIFIRPFWTADWQTIFTNICYVLNVAQVVYQKDLLKHVIFFSIPDFICSWVEVTYFHVIKIDIFELYIYKYLKNVRTKQIFLYNPSQKSYLSTKSCLKHTLSVLSTGDSVVQILKTYRWFYWNQNGNLQYHYNFQHIL